MRRRTHQGGGTGGHGAGRIGGMRRTFGPLPPAPSAFLPAAWPSRPMPPRCRLLPTLVLLVLMAGSGATVDAAPDPTVEAVQQALVERGFDPGRVDGAMGRRTRGALRAFQRAAGLPDTGEVDDATARALGLKPPR